MPGLWFVGHGFSIWHSSPPNSDIRIPYGYQGPTTLRLWDYKTIEGWKGMFMTSLERALPSLWQLVWLNWGFIPSSVWHGEPFQSYSLLEASDNYKLWCLERYWKKCMPIYNFNNQKLTVGSKGFLICSYINTPEPKYKQDYSYLTTHAN